jgi:nitronate monooxygenase
MIVASSAADIVRSTAVTGLPANYLVKSFEALGIDAASLPERQTSSFSFGKRGDGTDAKAWRDVWSAGQGVGGIDSVLPAAQIVDQIAEEFRVALSLMRSPT